MRLLALALACLAFAFAASAADLPAPPIAGATVKISIATAEGSGVHIGNGLILTAAHNVRDESMVTITTDRGDELEGEVLWSHEIHDLAMVRSPHLVARTAQLACRPLIVGEPLTATGHALGLEFVRVWGRVAAPAAALGERSSIVLADMTVAPGMSGGAVFDSNGDLVGIMLALTKSRLGAIPLAWLLPAEAICKALEED